MTITTKEIKPSTEYASEQDWAENTVGVYMNMLSGCRFDPIDNTYKVAPIKYSDTSLYGEKLKFANNVELTVIHSCLATEYKNNSDVREEWWNKAKELVASYKAQSQLEEHLATTNTDLTKLRNEGLLDNLEGNMN